MQLFTCCHWLWSSWLNLNLSRILIDTHSSFDMYLLLSWLLFIFFKRIWLGQREPESKLFPLKDVLYLGFQKIFLLYLKKLDVCASWWIVECVSLNYHTKAHAKIHVIMFQTYKIIARKRTQVAIIVLKALNFFILSVNCILNSILNK